MVARSLAKAARNLLAQLYGNRTHFKEVDRNITLIWVFGHALNVVNVTFERISLEIKCSESYGRSIVYIVAEGSEEANEFCAVFYLSDVICSQG